MSEEKDDDKDPMVIHDAVEQCVYMPKMKGYDPEVVCTTISSAIESIHVKGLSKEHFFPTFLISEMAQDATHSWAKEEGHYGFIYGYVFGSMLSNFEKNKDTKLEWDKRPMNEEELAENDLFSGVENFEDIKKIIENLEAGTEDSEGLDFEPPETWSPDDLEGYDPTK